MTESGKQKLRFFSIILLFVSMFFWLEGRGNPGWKTGMALLPMAVIATIDSYLAKGAWRLPFIAFCLFFFIYAMKNFLAP